MTQARQELLRLLSELGSRYPEMRLGQMISWLASAARDGRVESTYDVEDEELIAAIREHLANPLARTGQPSSPIHVTTAS